ncbi:hypothetical protein QPX96_05745 [Limosilactobacillus fermentum]|nr:hypothetical protein [Limosilactobacillus fermentum]
MGRHPGQNHRGQRQDPQITVLKHPTGGKSDEINSRSLPTYKQEALAAQSANINQVSGATETYKGSTGSLQSAWPRS